METFLLFNPDSPLIFTQFYFWAFFGVVYAIFTLIGNRILLRNSFLFFASLFFYYRTSGLSVLLLVFAIAAGYLLARWMAQCRKGGFWRGFFLVCSVVIELGLLCYFKYAYFFADVLKQLTGIEMAVTDVFAQVGNMIAGKELFKVDAIVLPVGISFFIFQLISYAMDVYRDDVKPVKNILDFGFYVSFFPQLVAGPIVRASEFIPQLHRKFNLSRRGFGIAVFWILNGLAKKIILSDYIAVNFVDRVFDNPLLFSGFENLVALFAYSLQVYADFSGYTDIAIGVAALMGFYLPQNFNSPYKATNPQDFWRRWHMSLSRWLKAYLYIPLGGNRRASFGTWFWILVFAAIALILSGSAVVAGIIAVSGITMTLIGIFSKKNRKKIISNINRFITMLFGGMWHGASWNFIIWGGLNGIGMIIYILWKDMKWGWRVALTLLATGGVYALRLYYPAPVWNILLVWSAVIAAVTLVRGLNAAVSRKPEGSFRGGLATFWGVAQTFTFITFTRLFFRSGSNLDPATANEVAWKTARDMVIQIGSVWNPATIPSICFEYRRVFLLVIAGLVIHWIPERWKRHYRLAFASTPLPIMAVLAVAVIMLVYQFVTADTQPFIYFQF